MATSRSATWFGSPELNTRPRRDATSPGASKRSGASASVPSIVGAILDGHYVVGAKLQQNSGGDLVACLSAGDGLIHAGNPSDMSFRVY